MSGRGVDFFVSHAGRDTAWAEWLAWQLEHAGYRAELDVWAGLHATTEGFGDMQDAGDLPRHTFPLRRALG